MHNPLPPSEVLETLIALRETADALIQHDGSDGMGQLREDDFMRHCHLFLKRRRHGITWHQTRQ